MIKSIIGDVSMDFYLLDHEATFKELEKFNYPNQRVGVIAHIVNEKGEVLLQQRGIKARDENGLYEDIGGGFEPDLDINFKAAVIREIKEEAGTNLTLEIGDSIGICHFYKHSINWIFIIYFVRYLSGDFQIMETEKCNGYRFFSYDEALKSDLVTESCKFLIESIKENYLHDRS